MEAVNDCDNMIQFGLVLLGKEVACLGDRLAIFDTCTVMTTHPSYAIARRSEDWTLKSRAASLIQ